ncbi:PTS sugar transporter subunit IIB [Streptococcus merionis]|uniref:PTS system, lactose/cellobiose-specific IIB component n=1 Tax=Streptococcus merionis TaxID=400065 RepID=A0A239SW87_9STRE|nr:PTS sugar transporter subunit IIB [Streptococcus merionis]SNU89751.1 PTS system, lactose/cellobiose-specific IIB component [Streptococcus merionis]
MRIMLACAAGMSTSILVAKMEEAAKEQGKDYKIWAIDQSLIEDNLGNFDVLLLGPQVQHTLKKVKNIVGDRAPVAVIKASDYGRGNGAAVLKHAEELIGG